MSWVPDWLQTLLSGGEAPEADENRLYALADRYAAAAAYLREELPPDIEAVANAFGSAYHGEAGVALSAYLKRFAGNPDEPGPAMLADSTERVGEFLRTMGDTILRTKRELLIIGLVSWATVLMGMGPILGILVKKLGTAAVRKIILDRVKTLVRSKAADLKRRMIGEMAANASKQTGRLGRFAKTTVPPLMGEIADEMVPHTLAGLWGEMTGQDRRLATDENGKPVTTHDWDWRGTAMTAVGATVGFGMAKPVGMALNKIPGLDNWVGRRASTFANNALTSPLSSSLTGALFLEGWHNPAAEDYLIAGGHGVIRNSTDATTFGPLEGAGNWVGERMVSGLPDAPPPDGGGGDGQTQTRPEPAAGTESTQTQAATESSSEVTDSAPAPVPGSTQPAPVVGVAGAGAAATGGQSSANTGNAAANANAGRTANAVEASERNGHGRQAGSRGAAEDEQARQQVVTGEELATGQEVVGEPEAAAEQDVAAEQEVAAEQSEAVRNETTTESDQQAAEESTRDQHPRQEAQAEQLTERQAEQQTEQQTEQVAASEAASQSASETSGSPESTDNTNTNTNTSEVEQQVGAARPTSAVEETRLRTVADAALRALPRSLRKNVTIETVQDSAALQAKVQEQLESLRAQGNLTEELAVPDLDGLPAFFMPRPTGNGVLKPKGNDVLYVVADAHPTATDVDRSVTNQARAIAFVRSEQPPSMTAGFLTAAVGRTEMEMRLAVAYAEVTRDVGQRTSARTARVPGAGRGSLDIDEPLPELDDRSNAEDPRPLDMVSAGRSRLRPDEPLEWGDPVVARPMLTEALEASEAYRQLSNADQDRVLEAVAAITVDDPARVEGIRPLLRSPGFRGLGAEELVAEVESWQDYTSLFGRAIELGASAQGAPARTDSLEAPSYSWDDAHDLGTRSLPERLGEVGQQGQVSTAGTHAGVYAMPGPDGREWIVKLFPDNGQYDDALVRELESLQVAARTGFGPTPYGLVRLAVDQPEHRYVGVAMARVDGRHASVHGVDESARGAVTFDTVLQLYEYVRRLADIEQHYHGEPQGLIDPENGNFRPIDLADLGPIVDDPEYRRLAAADYGFGGLEAARIRDHLLQLAITNERRRQAEVAARSALDGPNLPARLREKVRLAVLTSQEFADRYGHVEPSDGLRQGHFEPRSDGGADIVVVVDAISTRADVEQTVLHEVGHLAFAAASAAEQSRLADAIERMPDTPLIRRWREEIERLYGYRRDGLSDEGFRRLVDDELLARAYAQVEQELGGVPSPLRTWLDAFVTGPFGRLCVRLGLVSSATLEAAKNRRDHELAPFYRILGTALDGLRRRQEVHPGNRGPGHDRADFGGPAEAAQAIEQGADHLEPDLVLGRFRTGLLRGSAAAVTLGGVLTASLTGAGADGAAAYPHAPDGSGAPVELTSDQLGTPTVLDRVELPSVAERGMPGSGRTHDDLLTGLPVRDSGERRHGRHGRWLGRRRRRERRLAAAAQDWDGSPSEPGRRRTTWEPGTTGSASMATSSTELAPSVPRTADPEAYAALGERVAARITELRQQEQRLTERAAAKRASAEVADRAAAQHRNTASEEARLADSGSTARAHKARTAAQSARDKANRHRQIADAYRRAAQRAGEALDAARQLADEIAAIQASQEPGERLPELAYAADARFHDFLRSIQATRPPREVLPGAAPEGPPPLLSALTTRINQMLKLNGVRHRYHEQQLGWILSSEFRQVTSDDGLVLTIDGDARDDVTDVAQVWIQLRAGELDELLRTDPNAPVASEMIDGKIDHSGHGGSAQSTQAVDLTYGAGSKLIASLLPDSFSWKQPVQAASETFGVNVERGGGQRREVSSGWTRDGRDSTVLDNRAEAVAYEASEAWEIRVRTSALDSWSEPEVVDSGEPSDAGGLRAWVSHAYTVAPSEATTSIEQDGRGEQPSELLPDHKTIFVNGLEGLADDTVSKTVDLLGKLDRVAHDHIRWLLTRRLPSQLREASRPGGIGQPIFVDGQPVAFVQVRAYLRRGSARRIGVPSFEHWIERLRVGLTGETGGQTFHRSGSWSVRLSTGWQDVGSSVLDLGPEVSGGRGTVRNDGTSVGRTGIDVGLRRCPTTAFGVRVTYEVTVQRLGSGERRVSERSGDAMLRMAENDAFWYGLPVDRDAVVRTVDDQPNVGEDGRTLLRADPQPTSETLELPFWFGSGPGQLAGPAQVRLTEVEQARVRLLRALSEQGVVPPLDADLAPILGEMPLDRQLANSQLANLQRVRQLFPAVAAETWYAEVAKHGVGFHLTLHRTGVAPETRIFRLRLGQDLDNATYLGPSRFATVRLPIGSDSVTRSRGRSKKGTVSASMKAGEIPDDGGNHVFTGGYNRTFRTRSIGWTTGSMVNRVSLVEPAAEVAEFQVESTLEISETDADGRSWPLIEDVGCTARLQIDSDLCRRAPGVERQPDGSPAPGAATTGETEPALLDAGRVVTVDAGDPLAEIGARLPPSVPVDAEAKQKLANFLHPTNLSTHSGEWRNSGYRTHLTTNPSPDLLPAVADERLGGQRTLQVSVTGEVRNERVIAVSSQITGDIGLMFQQSGVAEGRFGESGIQGGSTDGAQNPAQSSEGALVLGRTGNPSWERTTTAHGGSESLIVRGVGGRHYLFLSDVSFTAELGEGGQQRGPRIPFGDGKMLWAVPEQEALRLYGRGLRALPVGLVADAVERLRTGKLDLEPAHLAAVLRRYREARAAAAEEGTLDGLAAGHTNAVLRRLVGTTIDSQSPASEFPASQSPPYELPASEGERATYPEQAGRASDATRVAASARGSASAAPAEVTLPTHYERMLAMGLVERIASEQDPDRALDLLAVVRGVVGQIAPDALSSDPVLAENLSADLGGEAVREHVENILDPKGFERSYPVRGFGADAGEELTVRIIGHFDGQVTTDGDPDNLIREDAIEIRQRYLQLQQGRSMSRGSSYSVSADGTLGSDREGALGAATDRSRQRAATSHEQLVRLQRLAHFDVTRVARGLQLTVVVEHRRRPGATRRGSESVVLHARVTQLVPRGLVSSAGHDRSSAGPGVLRPWPGKRIRLPEDCFVEGTLPYRPPAADTDPHAELFVEPRAEPRDELFESVYRGLEAGHLLTRAGARIHRSDLKNQLSAAQRNAAFPMMTGPAGHPLVRLPTANGQWVYVRVAATVTDVERLTEPIEGEIGNVNRRQEGTQTGMSGNRTHPVTTSVGRSNPATGVSGAATFGEQTVSDVNVDEKTRKETSEFKKGQVVTVGMRVSYDLRFQRGDLETLEAGMANSTIESDAAAGHVVLTMFYADYLEMQRNLEPGDRGARSTAPTDPGHVSSEAASGPGQAGQEMDESAELGAPGSVAASFAEARNQAALAGIDLDAVAAEARTNGDPPADLLRVRAAAERARWEGLLPLVRRAVVSAGFTGADIARVLSAGLDAVDLMTGGERLRRRLNDTQVADSADSADSADFDAIARLFGFGRTDVAGTDGLVERTAFRRLLIEAGLTVVGSELDAVTADLLRNLAGELALRYGLFLPEQRRQVLEVHGEWLAAAVATRPARVSPVEALPYGRSALPSLPEAPAPSTPDEAPMRAGSPIEDPGIDQLDEGHRERFDRTLRRIVGRFHHASVDQAYRDAGTVGREDERRVAEALWRFGVPYAARLASQLPGARFDGDLSAQDFSAVVDDPNAPRGYQLRRLDAAGAETRWVPPGADGFFHAVFTVLRNQPNGEALRRLYERFGIDSPKDLRADLASVLRAELEQPPDARPLWGSLPRDTALEPSAVVAELREEGAVPDSLDVSLARLVVERYGLWIEVYDESGRLEAYRPAGAEADAMPRVGLLRIGDRHHMPVLGDTTGASGRPAPVEQDTRKGEESPRTSPGSHPGHPDQHPDRVPPGRTESSVASAPGPMVAREQRPAPVEPAARAAREEQQGRAEPVVRERPPAATALATFVDEARRRLAARLTGNTERTHRRYAEPVRLLEELVTSSLEREHLLRRFDDGSRSDIRPLARNLLSISRTLSAYAVSARRHGLDRPVSLPDPLNAREFTARTWDSGRHQQPSAYAEDAALIAAMVEHATSDERATDARYRPLTGDEIRARARPGDRLVDIAARLVYELELERTAWWRTRNGAKARALRAQGEFRRAVTAEYRRSSDGEASVAWVRPSPPRPPASRTEPVPPPEAEPSVRPGGTGDRERLVVPEFEEETKATEAIVMRESSRGFNAMTKAWKASPEEPGFAPVLAAVVLAAGLARSGRAVAGRLAGVFRRSGR